MSLHNDSRWNPLLELVLENKKKAFPNLDLIQINGFKVEMITYGMENNQKGKPVIVFENGRGTDFEYWLSIIIKEVSKGNVTFAYNRPRIGSSEDDNQLPTIDHITEILRQSLLAKGLYPPYILVGHSWGAACISNRNSLPDVPVHFIMAGGYPLNPEATSDYGKMMKEKETNFNN